MKTLRCAISATTCLVLLTTPAWGQSPSATYDPATGIMTIDSGGVDLVAVFIEGPDVSAGQGCNLCDGMNLPAEDPAGFDASTWTLGFINGSSQWIRTSPLQGRGFVGTIADSFVDGMGQDQPWPDDFPPFLDFPDVGGGIANYGAGTPVSAFGAVTFATDGGDVFHQNCIAFFCGGPTANDDEYVTALGTILDVAAPGVLSNDDDPSGYGLSASIVTDPLFGDVTVNSDGSFTYVAPPAGAFSPGTIDTFTYEASNIDSFDTGTVRITLVPEPSGSLWLLAVIGVSWQRYLRRSGWAESRDERSSLG